MVVCPLFFPAATSLMQKPDKSISYTFIADGVSSYTSVFDELFLLFALFSEEMSDVVCSELETCSVRSEKLLAYDCDGLLFSDCSLKPLLEEMVLLCSGFL